MRVARLLGNMVSHMDRRFGLRALLKGEPRPPAGGFDLDGEKIIDWGWICTHLPAGPKRAMDIGCGGSPIIPAMLALGYEAVGVDLSDSLSRQVAGFRLIRGDFNLVEFSQPFDIIVACSAIEHVGLSGRFGSSEDQDGDLKAMQKVASLLVAGGLFYLTIPVGIDAVHRPWHRVYGRVRLPKLLNGFERIQSRYLLKDAGGPWRETTEGDALGQPVEIRRYALGQMILTRQPKAGESVSEIQQQAHGTRSEPGDKQL